MNREEQIKQKAHEISQMCFPDSQNIWARQNIEAQLVQSACCEMVRWADENPKEGLVSLDRACEYLDSVLYEVVSGISGLPDVMSIENTTMEDFIKKFRKAMENDI